MRYLYICNLFLSKEISLPVAIYGNINMYTIGKVIRMPTLFQSGDLFVRNTTQLYMWNIILIRFGFTDNLID